MKKIIVLGSVLGLLCACAGMNKNTVSYQMSKYDQHIYYVVSGEGPTKEEASVAALDHMRKNLRQNVVEAENLPEVNDLISNAKIAKVWKDKSNKSAKNYFALAVLKRENAEKILQRPINELDLRLYSLAEKLNISNEKFAGLKSAFAMESLIVKRNIYQDLYMFVSQDRVGYETEKFEGLKKRYNDRLASIKVAVMVRGAEENAVLLSRIVDAVNKMGLSAVSPDDPTALLCVEVDASVDGYESERLKGLEWAATSASVSLCDLEADSIFARFNVYDRAGTGRRADSLRKSMEGVGNKASVEVVERLKNYLKTK